ELEDGRLVSGCGLTDVHARREASAPAFMCASAEMVTIGFTPDAVGNAEPSQTTTSRLFQSAPSQSQADDSGDPPIRAVPIWWNEKRLGSDVTIRRAPAASSTRTAPSR